jgi:hypothetical protein
MRSPVAERALGRSLQGGEDTVMAGTAVTEQPGTGYDTEQRSTGTQVRQRLHVDSSLMKDCQQRATFALLGWPETQSSGDDASAATVRAACCRARVWRTSSKARWASAMTRCIAVPGLVVPQPLPMAVLTCCRSHSALHAHVRLCARVLVCLRRHCGGCCSTALALAGRGSCAAKATRPRQAVLRWVSLHRQVPAVATEVRRKVPCLSNMSPRTL